MVPRLAFLQVHTSLLFILLKETGVILKSTRALMNMFATHDLIFDDPAGFPAWFVKFYNSFRSFIIRYV